MHLPSANCGVMFEKDMHKYIKRIAAITLLCAFFLPLSQCTVSTSPGVETQQVSTEVTYVYSAYKWPSLGSFMALIAFFWPLGSFLKSGGSASVMINSVELLLCAGTGFMLFALINIGSLLVGAYVAIASVTTYALATILQMTTLLSNNEQNT